MCTDIYIGKSPKINDFFLLIGQAIEGTDASMATQAHTRDALLML